MTPSAESVPADELIVAYVVGEHEAFRLLFERHHPPLVRYLTAQTGDPALAEDLAQDAFLEAYRCLSDLIDGRPFAPWFYRIAQHRLRRVWRRRSLLRFLSLDAGPVQLGLMAAIGQRPDEPTVSFGERDLIRRVLDGLSPGQREALLLHDVEGLTAREIAEVVGGSPVAVERQVSRARARFRALYNAIAGGME